MTQERQEGNPDNQRLSQVSQILQEVRDWYSLKMAKSNKNGESEALAILQSVSDASLDLSERALTLERAGKKVTLLSHGIFIVANMVRIKKAIEVSDSNRKPVMFFVGATGFEIPDEIRNAFRSNLQTLEEACAFGREYGLVSLLSYMEAQIPLIPRLNKSDAEKKGILHELSNGTHIASLPTKVEGVSLQYIYKNGEELPKLSFYITPRTV